LRGVGLSERRDTCLVQDRELGQVRHFLSDVSRSNTIFSSCQVLGLIVDDGNCALKPVNGGTEITARAGYRLNGGVDADHRRLGRSRGRQSSRAGAAAKGCSVAETESGVVGGGTMGFPPVPATFAVKITVEGPADADASTLATVPAP